METIIYKISDKRQSGCFDEMITIEAIKNSKVVKTIVFYNEVETAFGIEKMRTYDLGMFLNSNYNYEGKTMQITREIVEKIIEKNAKLNFKSFTF